MQSQLEYHPDTDQAPAFFLRERYPSYLPARLAERADGRSPDEGPLHHVSSTNAVPRLIRTHGQPCPSTPSPPSSRAANQAQAADLQPGLRFARRHQSGAQGRKPRRPGSARTQLLHRGAPRCRPVAQELGRMLLTLHTRSSRSPRATRDAPAPPTSHSQIALTSSYSANPPWTGAALARPGSGSLFCLT